MHYFVVSCPSEIRKYADGYKDLLGAHYKAFVAVLCGHIFGLSSFSDIMRYLFFSPSVSSLSAMFSDMELYEKINKRHRKRIYKILEKSWKNPSRYVWAIDDTLIPHWGKKIWGCYNWKDHNTNGYVWGHKLLVLGLVDTKRKIFIPVFWEVLHRNNTKKEKEQEVEEYKKGWEVAFELLILARDAGYPQFTIVMDSWFAGSELFQKLTEEEFAFVIELKSNRNILTHGRKVINESVKLFFSNRFRSKIYYLNRPKWATSATVLLRGMGQKIKVVAVANKKGLVHECFAYYATNRLAWDATKVWGISRDRWSIEVQFRDLKQLFTLGGSAVRSKQAVETSISISMIALTVVRLEQLNQVVASENQYMRPIPASSIVQKIMIESLNRGITKLTTSNNGPTLEKIQQRLSRKNFGRKPTENINCSKMAYAS